MIAAVIPLNNIMSKTPKKSDASHQAPKSLVNPIGLIGAVLSAIALAVGLYSSSIIDSLESRKVPNRHYETHDATIITDKAGNAFTFVEQAIIFVGRGLVCGTLAIVGVVLGCAGLVRSPRVYGLIAIALSLATFGTMLGGK